MTIHGIVSFDLGHTTMVDKPSISNLHVDIQSQREQNRGNAY